MSCWYPLEPVDGSFLVRAPEIYRYVIDVRVDSERLQARAGDARLTRIAENT